MLLLLLIRRNITELLDFLDLLDLFLDEACKVRLLFVLILQAFLG